MAPRRLLGVTACSDRVGLDVEKCGPERDPLRIADQLHRGGRIDAPQKGRLRAEQSLDRMARLLSHDLGRVRAAQQPLAEQPKHVAGLTDDTKQIVFLLGISSAHRELLLRETVAEPRGGCAGGALCSCDK